VTGKGKQHILLLTILWLLVMSAPVAARECMTCHAVTVRGAHAVLVCTACHGDSDGGVRRTADSTVVDCSACHPGLQGVLHGAMAHRRSEKAFAGGAFARYDERFFEKNCSGCHLSACSDCHGEDGHAIVRPGQEDCHQCHRGYFVGADYLGRAPREDSLRYQRGVGFDGEKYLKMRPDVHAEVGLGCGSCHAMASLAAGTPAKGCRDCHQPDPRIVEHRIAAHQEKLECYACHSAWGAQEYGSFFLRVGDNPLGEIFRVRREPGSEYLRSAYLKSQDAPPLGWNAAGKVSPIRPQFIAYYSDLRPGGKVENDLVAVQWKAFFPHTIRRATITCDGCHNAPRRFLLEAAEKRIYLPARDGMTLPSFWDSRGQTLVNGRFFTLEEFSRLSGRTPEFVRSYVEKWQDLVQRVGASSRH
jgi:hypothetical protein